VKLDFLRVLAAVMSINTLVNWFLYLFSALVKKNHFNQKGNTFRKKNGNSGCLHLRFEGPKMKVSPATYFCSRGFSDFYFH
jgi:hypothetical protein